MQQQLISVTCPNLKLNPTSWHLLCNHSLSAQVQPKSEQRFTMHPGVLFKLGGYAL
jgi:hypothetical protein